jgi:adenylylsulfate kinase-like enzyme
MIVVLVTISAVALVSFTIAWYVDRRNRKAIRESVEKMNALDVYIATSIAEDVAELAIRTLTGHED